MSAEVYGRTLVSRRMVKADDLDASQSPHAIILSNVAAVVEDVMAAGRTIDVGTMTVSVRRYGDHYWVAVSADEARP